MLGKVVTLMREGYCLCFRKERGIMIKFKISANIHAFVSTAFHNLRVPVTFRLFVIDPHCDSLCCVYQILSNSFVLHCGDHHVRKYVISSRACGDLDPAIRRLRPPASPASAFSPERPLPQFLYCCNAKIRLCHRRCKDRGSIPGDGDRQLPDPQ